MSRKDQLIAELADARAAMQQDVAGLRQRLNVPSRIKSSLSRNAKKWAIGSFVGAAAIGMLAKAGPGRRGSLVGRLVRTTVFSLAKPYLKTWIMSKVGTHLAERAQIRSHTDA